MFAKIIPQNIMIGQTDNIGDLVLTLPMIGALKRHYPHSRISLLARNYTKAIADGCSHIDHFLNWDYLKEQSDQFIQQELSRHHITALIHISHNKRLAKLASRINIPHRIGTGYRLYHLLYCNRWINLTRRNARGHEVQLNMKLLRPFGITQAYTVKQLEGFLNLQATTTLPTKLIRLLDNERFNLILHPGSKGHGREWPVNHFVNLIKRLDPEQFNIFITGSEQERERFQEDLLKNIPDYVHDVMAQNLTVLIAFIQQCDGLVASGTGPLHLAAALGIKTLGLFPPRKSVNPRRWAPVGKQAQYLVYPRPRYQACLTCRNSLACLCMRRISVDQVQQILQLWQQQHGVKAQLLNKEAILV